MIKAISPQEVDEAQAQGKHLPDGVIKAVNELLIKKGSGNYITLSYTQVKTAICEQMGITATTLVQNKHWLDFEPMYRAQGWSVDCESPAYCESGETTWTFKKPASHGRSWR